MRSKEYRQLFPYWELFVSCRAETLACRNPKCLEIKIEQQASAVPDRRMAIRRQDAPSMVWLNELREV
jgi:hypothetical protein